MKSKEGCICVTSGGMDSVSMSLKMYADGYKIWLFHVDLKQKCETKEHEAVKKIASILKVPYMFVDCSWLGSLGGSSLTDENIPVPNGMDSMKESLHITSWDKPGLWTPGRNVVLLGTAAAFAESVGATLITFGANQSETAYPDNTIEFADRFSHMLEMGCLKPPKVVVPLYELDKVQLLKWGYDNGFKEVYRYTWSCDNGFELACGVCGCCCNRRLAFKILGSNGKKYKDEQNYMDEDYFERKFIPDLKKSKGNFWWNIYLDRI